MLHNAIILSSLDYLDSARDACVQKSMVTSGHQVSGKVFKVLLKADNGCASKQQVASMEA